MEPQGRIWILLCDGKKVQVYEKEAGQGVPVMPVFEAPLGCCQLQHEIRWHFGDVSSNGTLVEGVRALLVNAALKGKYTSLVLVAKPEVGAEIRASLPARLQQRIVQSIEKDLTYCHQEAISSYFSQLA